MNKLIPIFFMIYALNAQSQTVYMCKYVNGETLISTNKLSESCKRARDYPNFIGAYDKEFEEEYGKPLKKKIHTSQSRTKETWFYKDKTVILKDYIVVEINAEE